MVKLSSPKEASTVLDEISSNLVGSAPEFINSTKFLASSSVKFPWMITSLENPWETVAALRQWESVREPQVSFSLE